MNVVLFLETRNQYHEILVGTIAPYVREGLNSIYREAMGLAEKSGRRDETLEIFQTMLRGVEKWNQDMIMKETVRIKRMSGTEEYFDNLVKAVIKSNIIVLTCTNTISNVIGQTFYNNFRTETLIHRCYIESAKDIHNNPFLFDHDAPSAEIKKCQVIVNQIVEKCIGRSINKVLPIASILNEYLVNSVNILPEPAKVELINQYGQMVPPMMSQYQPQYQPTKFNTFNPQVAAPIFQASIIDVKQNEVIDKKSDKRSEKKPVEIDNKLNKEIMNIINSEQKQSEHEKIQKIIAIDRAIASITPIRDRDTEQYLPVHMMDERSNSRNPAPANRDLLKINFDDQTTEQPAHMSSVKVDMSPLTNKLTRRTIRPIEGTDINPELIDEFVEEYGGSNKKYPFIKY